MKCDHRFVEIMREDVQNIDFYKTKEGHLSKRWKTLKCKKCGQRKIEPIL